MGYFDSLRVMNLHNGFGFSANSSEAQLRTSCPDCAAGTMFCLAYAEPPESSGRLSATSSAWLLCASCGAGAFVLKRGEDIVLKHPQELPLGVPTGLTDGVRNTWEEALRSYSANAYTSCTLMCRKIIFHMAVEAGLPAANDKGFAPRFVECVDKLVEEGWITARHRDQWVDSIREWGNKATHELDSIDETTAMKALEFTFQLLQMGYAFPSASPAVSE
mgnify:CR=1 FL=1